MDNQQDHHENDAWEEQEVAFFRNIDIPLGEDKETLWESFSEEINTPKPAIVRVMWGQKMAVAAVLLITFSILFCKYYSVSIVSENGQHLAHELPDGSTVVLNAGTTVTYVPYWWRFNRAIELEGEAYFEVKKGNAFVVNSKKGTTEVLGTSFNIFSRENEYQVLCSTGRVKVTTNKSLLSVVLSPNEMAVIDQDNQLKKRMNQSVAKVLGWKKNLFHFDGRALKIVFKELERQYDVEIELPKPLNERFTGIFEKKEAVEPILELICVTFNLKYTKISKQSYRIEYL